MKLNTSAVTSNQPPHVSSAAASSRTSLRRKARYAPSATTNTATGSSQDISLPNSPVNRRRTPTAAFGILAAGPPQSEAPSDDVPRMRFIPL
jgi:hypothetical protein